MTDKKLQVSKIDTPIGTLVAGVVSGSLCLLEFDEPGRIAAQISGLQRHIHCAVEHREIPLHQDLREELEQYFAGMRQVFSLPLVTPGSVFQQKTWETLRSIPFGATSTYVRIARQMGAPRAARAVGAANGRNRLAIVIPCHRVIQASGKLGGYGGGIWRKQWLLAFEQHGSKS